MVIMIKLGNTAYKFTYFVFILHTDHRSIISRLDHEWKMLEMAFDFFYCAANETFHVKNRVFRI